MNKLYVHRIIGPYELYLYIDNVPPITVYEHQLFAFHYFIRRINNAGI